MMAEEYGMARQLMEKIAPALISVTAFNFETFTYLICDSI